MKVQSAALAMTVAFAFGTFGACSPGSTTPSGAGLSSNGGGGAGTGGSSDNGGGASCSDVMPCGGNVVGAWTVTSSCLKVSGELDLTLANAGCKTAPVSGSLQITGTFTANVDGTYSDSTITSGEEKFTLAPSCLIISSTPTTCEGAASIIKNLGYSSVSCTSATGGGCSCSAAVHQTGGLALVSFAPSTNGNYASSSNLITISGDSGDSKYSYCVSGNHITMTPQSASPIVTGTIAFEKSDSSGAGGGQGGAGGAGGAGGSSGEGGAGGAGGAGGSGSTTGPCDIYKSGGNPCVAAHSTVRALFASYNGKLYQVRNAGGTTKDIVTLGPGGFADGPSQDTFCAGTTCVITVVYDQSGKGNDLWYQGSTMVPASTSSTPARATTESLTISGHKVYSLYINPNNSYWVDASKSGIPLGKEPEGMYMVTSGKHFNGGCCFDYGNSETDRKADGSGAMDALNLSSITAWGTGAGTGPWVMADLEYGVFAQNNTMKNMNNPSQTSAYVTAVLKNNGTTEFALRGSDATSGNLGTYYKGPLPGGWSPMKKQGAIILGSGGDCCKPGGGANLSAGTFYEGCLVSGYPSDVTEDAVQANIIGSRYGK